MGRGDIRATYTEMPVDDHTSTGSPPIRQRRLFNYFQGIHPVVMRIMVLRVNGST